MTKKPLLALALAMVAGLALFAVRNATEKPRPPVRGERLPHVIIYLIDTLRSDHLGVYGYDRDTSPTIDAFARDAILFREAYVQASWTRPSVASLFTALFPSRHGAMREEHRMRSDVPTLAELLKKQGYTTASFVSNPNVLPVFGFDRGFDVFRDVQSIERSARAEDVHAQVLDFLRQNQQSGSRQPLFLYIHTRDPHFPYEPPPPYDTRFTPRPVPRDASPIQRKTEKSIALYDGEISYADAEMAELFEQLKHYGIYEHALIIFLSDHGEEFLEHGATDHGHSLFQEQLRVPLIIRMPQGRRAGLAVDEPVRILDIVPTLCELLGIPTPPGIDGISFLPLINGQRREAYVPLLYAELNHGPHLIGSLIKGRYKIIKRRLSIKSVRTSFFDLAEDGREQRDLASTQVPKGVYEDMLGSLDLMDSILSSGVYVECVNGGSLHAEHQVEGWIQAEQGTFDDVTFVEIEEGDVIEVSDDQTRITFSVKLRNHPNPIRQNPPIMIDLDQIRFSLPPEAKFRVYVQIDGHPIDGTHMLLRRKAVPDDQLPLVSSASDERIQLESANLAWRGTRPDGAPYCRVYSVAKPQLHEAVVEDEVLERLRALGYVEQPAPEKIR